jgi:lactobin A/cerein 7B family class IIb bacteriocin
MQKKRKDDMAQIDALEIETLTDAELEAVEGGATNITTVASCSCCVAGATNIGGGKPV